MVIILYLWGFCMDEKEITQQDDANLRKMFSEIITNLYNSDEKFQNIVDQKEDIHSFNRHIFLIQYACRKSFSFFFTLFGLYYFSLFLSSSFEWYYFTMAVICFVGWYAFQRIFSIIYQYFKKDMNSEDDEYCINKLKMEIEKRIGKEVVVDFCDENFMIGIKKEEC